MSFSFTGFDGNNYEINDFSSFMGDYEHYFITYYNESTYFVILFNNDIRFTFHNAYDISISCDSGDTFRLLRCSNNGYSCYDAKGYTLTRAQATKVYCCEDLMEYKDSFSGYNFYFEVPKQEVQLFTLRPIVEEVNTQNDIVKTTFSEMFSILPVLITILISLIGIRKGISFIFSLLRNS